MNAAATPPRWAEALLESLLAPAARQSVTGDLLEEYRTSIAPQRGTTAANAWYVRQVAGFAWRHQLVSTGLLLLLFFGRSAYDALVPTVGFGTRSLITTWLVMVLWAGVGFAAVWRTGLLRSGLIAGAVTNVMTAALATIASLALIGAAVLAPSSGILAAMPRSGGLAEIFLIPLMVGPFGTALAGAAGVVAGVSRPLFRFANPST